VAASLSSVIARMEAAARVEWVKLTPSQQRCAAQLGYTQQSWESFFVPPMCCGSRWDRDPSNVQGWEELSVEHRAAAVELGWRGAEAWDAEMLERERPSDNHPASSMFAVAEKVLAFDTHGAVFWSKVLQRRKGTMLVGSTIARDNDALDQAKWHYKIHYMGWGARWDDWLDNRRIYKGSEEMASLLKQESGMGSGQFAILSEQEHKERLAAERVERLQRLAAARSASRNDSRKAKSNAAIQKQQREQKIIGSTLNRLVKSVERQARQEQQSKRIIQGTVDRLVNRVCRQAGQHARQRQSSQGSQTQCAQSRFRGVNRTSKGLHGGWQAQIRVNGRRHYLGVFRGEGAEEMAARAYDRAARELHSEGVHVSWFNFPTEGQEGSVNIDSGQEDEEQEMQHQGMTAARSASRNDSRKAKSNAAIQKQQREQKIIGSTLNRLVKSVERQARQEQQSKRIIQGTVDRLVNRVCQQAGQHARHRQRERKAVQSMLDRLVKRVEKQARWGPSKERLCKPPAPCGWTVHWDEPSERWFFWHIKSESSTWDLPARASAKPPPPPGWTVHWSVGSKRWFFWNADTKISTWHMPMSTEVRKNTRRAQEQQLQHEEEGEDREEEDDESLSKWILQVLPVRHSKDDPDELEFRKFSVHFRAFSHALVQRRWAEYCSGSTHYSNAQRAEECD
jgi:hypothetical protein